MNLSYCVQVPCTDWLEDVGRSTEVCPMVMSGKRLSFKYSMMRTWQEIPLVHKTSYSAI